MAAAQPKRHREVAGDSQIETTKRHKNTYINEQEESTQDLSDFFANISSDPFLDFIQQTEPEPDNNPTSNTKEELVDDGDEKERVIRHLLEASDDELGIPAVDSGGDGGGDGGGGNDEISRGGYGHFSLDLCYGFWELEDEAANYYTLLQSELFMQ